MTKYAHTNEPHRAGMGSKLNWLRAGVLGAEDGTVSTAGIVIGVIAAGAGTGQLFTAGVAAVTAGAVSMALGEYVSVSTQRDTEKALVEKERWELENIPEEEHEELVGILQGMGIKPETAEKAAQELQEHDLLKTHLQLELGIDQEELTNPWSAAGASALSFAVGAIIPLIVALLVPPAARLISVIVATVLTLVIAGTISAKLSDTAKPGRSVVRLAVGGLLALVVTFLIGRLFGTSVA